MTAVAVVTALLWGPVAAGGAHGVQQPAGPAARHALPQTEERLPLDLPLANADGELAGGVHPALPTDVARLRGLVAEARARDIAPERYAALLWQYWLARASKDAGIDLAAWDPAAGVHANRPTSLAIYTYYARLFLDHPDLHWMGLACMVGATFAAGFEDLAPLGDIGRLLAGEIDKLPPSARAALPREVRDLAERREPLPAEELQWYERKFLAMQKHIFMDQAAAHAAYLAEGLPAVREMEAAGLLDAAALRAWQDIDSGEPARVEAGNAALESREQNETIAGQWEEMRAHGGAFGEMLTYGFTVAGAPSIPGTRTPGQFAPLTVEGVQGGLRLRTPLPAFNIADRQARWTYIVQDALPVYQRLLREEPERARRIAATPFADRMAEQRLQRRWPQLALDLTTGWRLEAARAAGADRGVGDRGMGDRGVADRGVADR